MSTAFKGLLRSTEYEWPTPQWLFDELNSEFNFTLDPCATEENYKCDNYYTIFDNGLSKNWDHEVVFMNPPYGRAIAPWVKKASETQGTVVCLLPCRTDTAWWHDYIIEKNAEVRFIRGRLRFDGAKHNAPFASAVVIFRNLL